MPSDVASRSRRTGSSWAFDIALTVGVPAAVRLASLPPGSDGLPTKPPAPEFVIDGAQSLIDLTAIGYCAAAGR